MNVKIHAIWFFIIPALCLIAYGWHVATKKPYISPISYIVQDGKPTQAMQNLLKLSYIEYDGTFQDAVNATQKHWLRPSGVKRWEMDTTTYANRREIWDAFEKLHLSQSVEPVYNKGLIFKYTLYDYMIVVGGAYDGMKAKMQFIERVHKLGVDCGPVIFLVSDRNLDYEYESEAIMQDFEIAAELCPKTESDMIQFLVEKMLPKTLGYYGEREYVIAKCSPENSQPNTKDALVAWLATNPSPGKCLVISAQPYVAYQHSVFVTYMPKEFAIQTVGPATTEFMHTGVYFDTLTRILYQENIRMNNNQQ